MQNINLKEFTLEIRSLISDKKYNDVCQKFKINTNEFSALSVDLLLMLSVAIQLSDCNEYYTLDDARCCLLAAIKKNPCCVDAWIDLGYFYYAVDDKSDHALICFDKAQDISLSSGLINEKILTGKVCALLDLHRKEDALNLISSINDSSLKSNLEILFEDMS